MTEQMKQGKINELQIYLQMYDKGLLSKKTILEKIDINAEEEQKEIEKDIKFNNKRFKERIEIQIKAEEKKK